MHKTTPARIYQNSKNYLLHALLSIFLPIASFHSQIPNYVPSNDLVGWWPFTGNAVDSSGNGNDGTVNGATLSTDRFGAANSAYSFDGNDWISINDIGISGTISRSICFWAKTQSVSPMGLVSFGGNGIFPNNGNRFACDFNYIVPGVTIDGADCAITYSSVNPVSNNIWSFYVFTMNQGSSLSQVKVYQNGILLTNAIHNYLPATNLNTQASTQLQFGRINYPPLNFNFYNGALDDVGIWNRSLTECEIQNLYQATLLLSVDDISICQNGTGTLVAQTSFNGGNFQWSNGAQSSSISVSTPSTNTYYVSYTLNGLTCTDSAVVNVIPNQPAFFPSVNPICAGDPLAPLPTSSLNLFQGTWSPPINNMATTTYTFTPNLNVCAWDTTTLTVVVKPVPVLTSQDISTCIGQEVTISSTPDLPNGTFNWSNNTTSNQFILTADTSTFYTATYTLDGCTSLMDTVNVIVNALPLVSITPNGPTTFCAESSVNLTSSSNYGNLWSNGQNAQNITASVSGTYELIVTDSNGCADSASIIITNSGVPCLQIGGVFTPNGDGSNDTWQIIGIENYPDATIEIFNRWGQQLFFSKGYSVPWNGTYNNESLPTGDYFYIIDLGINDPIKGALTIKN